MPTLIGYHHVKDTKHWLASPMREKFFGPLGVTGIRTFVDPQNSTRVAVLMEVPAALSGKTDAAGFGDTGATPPKPDFWIGQGTPNRPAVHVAFRVGQRAQVDAFYAAGLAAGGRDNGCPGVRAHYHPGYYAAFVLDPDGHNIEAVCFEPA